MAESENVTPRRYNRGTPTVQTAPVVRSDYGTLATNTTLLLSTADVHLITLGASITLTLDVNSVPDRTKVRVYVTQDGTGSRVITWSGVTWLSGITPVLQTAASAVDLFEFTAFNASGVITWYGRQLGKNTNTVADHVSHSLTAGTHLSGGPFDGSAAVTISTDATNANTASTIVARDASGNFSAGTISAALSGNATTATSATSATTATTATTATNQSGGTVSATTGAFSQPITSTVGPAGPEQILSNTNIAPITATASVLCSYTGSAQFFILRDNTIGGMAVGVNEGTVTTCVNTLSQITLGSDGSGHLTARTTGGTTNRNILVFVIGIS